MSKVSQLFKVLVLIVIVASLTATPAFAQGPGKQTSTYQYDEWFNGYHYVGSGSYTWNSIINGTTSVYNWSGDGEFAVYDSNGTMIDYGFWLYNGHQTIKDGQSIIYHYSDRGSYQDDHSYKYIMSVVSGNLVMNHFWFDGLKMY